MIELPTELRVLRVISHSGKLQPLNLSSNTDHLIILLNDYTHEFCQEHGSRLLTKMVVIISRKLPRDLHVAVGSVSFWVPGEGDQKYLATSLKTESMQELVKAIQAELKAGFLFLVEEFYSAEI